MCPCTVTDKRRMIYLICLVISTLKPDLMQPVPSNTGCLLKSLLNAPSWICIDRLCRSICCVLVAMQPGSFVLWHPSFQGHVITVLDTAQAILITAVQTGIHPADVNLYGQKRPHISLCHTLSQVINTPGSCLLYFSEAAGRLWPAGAI